MKWANKEVKHSLASWLKERGILLVKRAFNIIKFFYPVKFGTNPLSCWVRPIGYPVSTYRIKIKVERTNIRKLSPISAV